MNTLLQLSLSANGTPSDVRSRIADQAKAADASPDQTAIIAALRAAIEKKLEGVSEDQTLSVSAAVTVTVADAPPALVAREADRQIELAALRKRAEAAEAADEARAREIIALRKRAEDAEAVIKAEGSVKAALKQASQEPATVTES